jgi:hypothetical protein
VGCILAASRLKQDTNLFHRIVERRVLTHTLKPALILNSARGAERRSSTVAYAFVSFFSNLLADVMQIPEDEDSDNAYGDDKGGER